MTPRSVKRANILQDRRHARSHRKHLRPKLRHAEQTRLWAAQQTTAAITALQRASEDRPCARTTTGLCMFRDPYCTPTCHLDW